MANNRIFHHIVCVCVRACMQVTGNVLGEGSIPIVVADGLVSYFIETYGDGTFVDGKCSTYSCGVYLFMLLVFTCSCS